MNITKICGDSAQCMKEQLADDSVHLTVTSPPYGELRSYLFANAVVWCDDIEHDRKQSIIRELISSGVKPRKTLR